MHSPDEGVAALDADLRYIFVNDAAERLVGLKRDQVLGRTPMALFPAEVLDEILPSLHEALRSGRMVRYDAYYPPSDTWFEHRLYPSASGVVVVFSDITERKAAEAQVRVREEGQRLLIQLTDATRPLADPEDVQWAVMTRVGAFFGVSRCTYGEIDDAQEHVTVTRDYVSGVASVAGRHRVNAFGPALIEDLQRGKTAAIADVAEDPRTAHAHVVDAFAAIQTRALLCVPLVKDGRFVALFVLHHSHARQWSQADVALMEQVDERTWLALENARALAALRESRDVLTLAMRGGRMGTWARNLVTGEVWWSRELEELFGLPVGAFSGSEAGFRAFVHDEDRPRLEAAVASAIATDSDYVVEFRFRHATQGWRWMDGRGRAVRAPDGTLQSLYGVGIDITERKNAEVALARARDTADADATRLGLALLTARLGEWTWDTSTDVVMLSPRAADVFGLPPEPTTWTAMRNLLHPGDRERTQMALEAAVAERGDYRTEYRVVVGERERWVSASGRARYAEDGRPIGMFGVVQDVTRDRLLIRLDDEVRSLSNSADITFAAARVLGEHLEVNRCAYAVVETDEDTFELTGNYTNGAPSIIGRYRFRQFGAECLRLMRSGLPCVVTDSETDPRLDDADREAYRATTTRAVIFVPILKGERFVAAMAVHTNSPRAWQSNETQLVSQVASRCWESLERARVERERVGLLAAAEDANRAKDEFLAMLGHELRNPLSPILTAVQLMRLRGDQTSERERTVIERQVTHLTRLIDDLLDVSRIARGKVELKTAPVEISDVVARAIEIASPLLEQRMQALVIDVPRVGLVLNADAARLSQVVSNLLTNAAKYTPPGGRVVLSAARHGTDLVLHVRDNGIGIAPDVLPRIFDLFMQGRQAIDRAEGGLGLGLAIVKSLVERHGGRVTAQSDGLDRGSVFEVTLPLADAHAAAPAGEAQHSTTPTVASPAPRTRIVVVDDNQDAAAMVAGALTLRGFDVRIAHDAPAALRIATAFHPEVAILDLGLPVMDGYELAVRLKQVPGLTPPRLIALTGYGQDSDRRRTAGAGFDVHLVKPVDLEALMALVHP